METGVISDFDNLVLNLVNGHKVRYVANYGLCDPSPGPAIGGDEIDVFQYFYDPVFGAEKISFTNSKLITNYQGKGHVYDMVSATLNKGSKDSNNKDMITYMASDISSQEWQPVYEEYFNCSIRDQSGQGAVLFKTMESVEPTLLGNFSELLNHIISGGQSRVVFVFENCPKYIGPFGTKSPKTLSAATLTTYEYFNASRFSTEEFFAFSVDKLIKNYVKNNSSVGPYLYDLVETKVWGNNTVHVRATGFSTTTQEDQFEEWFECSITSEDTKDKPQIKFYRS